MGSVGVELLNQRLKLEVTTQYDFDLEYFPRKVARVLYSAQCFSFYIDYTQFSYQDFFNERSDKRIEAALTLTHVGDIIRFRERSRMGGNNPYD